MDQEYNDPDYFPVKDSLQIEAASALRRIYNTEDGQLLFTFLKRNYCDMPCLDTSNVYKTYSDLANKELVEYLIFCATKHLENLNE